MDVRLDGAVALVTGGGGTFGRAYCTGLAAAGATVAVADLHEHAAESVAGAIRASGGNARAFKSNVALATEVDSLIDAVTTALGGVDILLTIAGDSSRYALRDLPEAEWDRVLEINLKGVYLCCKAVIPGLIKRGGGRILTMASSRGLHGLAYAAHYAASKAGVIALTKSLADELRPHRITVNALAPGATDTPMWEKMRSPQAAAETRQSGRLGRADDLVPLAVLLASPLGYEITGQVFVRDVFMPR